MLLLPFLGHRSASPETTQRSRGSAWAVLGLTESPSPCGCGIEVPVFLPAAAWGCPELRHVPLASCPRAPAQLSRRRLELSPREICAGFGSSSEVGTTLCPCHCGLLGTALGTDQLQPLRCRAGFSQPHGRRRCMLTVTDASSPLRYPGHRGGMRCDPAFGGGGYCL